MAASVLRAEGRGLTHQPQESLSGHLTPEASTWEPPCTSPDSVLSAPPEAWPCEVPTASQYPSRQCRVLA